MQKEKEANSTPQTQTTSSLTVKELFDEHGVSDNKALDRLFGRVKSGRHNDQIIEALKAHPTLINVKHHYASNINFFLLFTIEHGNQAIFDYLVKQDDLDVNVRTGILSALHYVAKGVASYSKTSPRFYTHVIKSLLEKDPALLNIQINYTKGDGTTGIGYTPLRISILCENFEATACLLSEGADLHLADTKGKSAASELLKEKRLHVFCAKMSKEALKKIFLREDYEKFFAGYQVRPDKYLFCPNEYLRLRNMGQFAARLEEACAMEKPERKKAVLKGKVFETLDYLEGDDRQKFLDYFPHAATLLAQAENTAADKPGTSAEGAYTANRQRTRVRLTR